MGKIRLGLIGCGQIARRNHVPEVQSLGDDAEIAAVYDIKRGKAESLISEHGISPRICRSLNEILSLDIDAVMIATPNCFHYPQTIAALNAGKHVLVEKPMAARVEDADAMISLAHRKKLVLQVNQSMRFVPMYVMVKKLIDEGAIGRPMHARCLRCCSASPDVGWSPGATWFVKRKYEGSLVTDIAVHNADALQWYFGPVRRVHAITRNLRHEVPDNVTAMFDFANGATGVLELSWTFPGNYGAFELYGDQGAIRFLQDGSGIELLPADGKPAKVFKADDFPSVPNSHACFVRGIRENAGDCWTVGRGALALCVAIVEANAAGAAVKPRNRRSR